MLKGCVATCRQLLQATAASVHADLHVFDLMQRFELTLMRDESRSCPQVPRFGLATKVLQQQLQHHRPSICCRNSPHTAHAMQALHQCNLCSIPHLPHVKDWVRLSSIIPRNHCTSGTTDECLLSVDFQRSIMPHRRLLLLKTFWVQLELCVCVSS